MPRRKQPKAAQDQKRKFWAWTRLKLSTKEKDRILLLLLNHLNGAGLLAVDFRRTASRNEIDKCLETVFEDTPIEFCDLYARRGKDMRIRLRSLLAALKKDFLKHRQYSRLELLPVEMAEAIARFLHFGDMFNMSVTSRQMRKHLKFERRRRMKGFALASRDDYFRVGTTDRWNASSLDDNLADTIDQPLRWAVANGWTGVIEAFLNKFTDPDSVDLYGNCMLYVAIMNNQQESARVLLEFSAQLAVLDPREYRTPLCLALFRRSPIVHDILEEGTAILKHREKQDLLFREQDDPEWAQWVKDQNIDILQLEETDATDDYIEPLPVIPPQDM